MKPSFLIFLSSIGFVAFSLLMTSNSISGQAVDEEIIENTFETVEKATSGISESTDSQFKLYESQPLGVKLQIPSQYNIVIESTKTENCFGNIKDCDTIISNDGFKSGNLSFYIVIEKHSFNGSLKDFVKHRYDYFKTGNREFIFLDDKEIKLNDIPAWQMEYKLDPKAPREMSIFTKVNNTYYKLSYSPNTPSVSSKYLPEALIVLNNIEFIPSKPPEEKRPSFLD